MYTVVPVLASLVIYRLKENVVFHTQHLKFQYASVV